MIGRPDELVKWLWNQSREKVFEIKEYKAKRSLNANSYFHKLVSMIAEVCGSSLIEIKNELIRDFGQYHYLENGEIDVSIKSENFNYLTCETEHYSPTDRYITDKGKKWLVYIVMRGSHTYSTSEMARLIDGAVSEAKELGIETLPPDELFRLIQKWKPKEGT